MRALRDQCQNAAPPAGPPLESPTKRARSDCFAVRVPARPQGGRAARASAARRAVAGGAAGGGAFKLPLLRNRLQARGGGEGAAHDPMRSSSAVGEPRPAPPAAARVARPVTEGSGAELAGFGPGFGPLPPVGARPLAERRRLPAVSGWARRG